MCSQISNVYYIYKFFTAVVVGLTCLRSPITELLKRKYWTLKTLMSNTKTYSLMTHTFISKTCITLIFFDD